VRVGVGDDSVGGEARHCAESAEEVVARLALEAGGGRGADDAGGIAECADVDGHIIEIVERGALVDAGEIWREASGGQRALPHALARGEEGEHPRRAVADRLAVSGIGVCEEAGRAGEEAGRVSLVVEVELKRGARPQAAPRDRVGEGARRTGGSAGGAGILGEVAPRAEIDAAPGGGIGEEGPPALGHAVQLAGHSEGAQQADVPAEAGVIVGEGVVGYFGAGGDALLGVVVGEGAVGAQLRALVVVVVRKGNLSVDAVQHAEPVRPVRQVY